MVNPDNEILISEGNLNVYWVKKPIWKGHILCDMKPMTSWKRQTMEAVVSRDWGSGGEQVELTTPYDTTMVDTYYTNVQTHKMFKTKSEP